MFSVSTVKKQWHLLNKNAIDKSIIKLTWSEEKEDLKESSLKTIIDALSSAQAGCESNCNNTNNNNDPKNNENLSKSNISNPATKALLASIQSITAKDWLKALKTLSLVHHLLNLYPHEISPILTELSTITSQHKQQQLQLQLQQQQSTLSVDISALVDQNDPLQGSVSTIPPSKPSSALPAGTKLTSSSTTHAPTKPSGVASTKFYSVALPEQLRVAASANNLASKDSLHMTLLGKYFTFLTVYNDRICHIEQLYQADITSCRAFSIAYPRIKFIMKLFAHVQFLQRDLESAISIYKRIIVTQRIVTQICQNVSRAYALVKPIVERVLPTFMEFESTTDFRRFFAFYSDFIKVTRILSKFNALRIHLSATSSLLLNSATTCTFDKLFKVINLYSIDKELNQEIELYNLNILREMSDECDNFNASSYTNQFDMSYDQSQLNISLQFSNRNNSHQPHQLQQKINGNNSNDDKFHAAKNSILDQEIEVVIPSKSIMQPVQYQIRNNNNHNHMNYQISPNHSHSSQSISASPLAFHSKNDSMTPMMIGQTQQSSNTLITSGLLLQNKFDAIGGDHHAGFSSTSIHDDDLALTIDKAHMAPSGRTTAQSFYTTTTSTSGSTGSSNGGVSFVGSNALRKKSRDRLFAQKSNSLHIQEENFQGASANPLQPAKVESTLSNVQSLKPPIVYKIANNSRVEYLN